MKKWNKKKKALITLATLLGPALMYGSYLVGYELGKTLANLFS